jgi:hypothetical protein
MLVEAVVDRLVVRMEPVEPEALVAVALEVMAVLGLWQVQSTQAVVAVAVNVLVTKALPAAPE